MSVFKASPSRAAALPESRLEMRLPDKAPRYTRGEAITEANRCIYCVDAPCVEACPTGIDIPSFIHKIATDNVKGAARTIFAANLLGTSCARVCPVEVLCAGSCVYNHWGREPIAIGRLQRYATENGMAADPELVSRARRPPTGKKIACIGGGPASLAAAGHLALDGHTVHIFEKRAFAGGLNTTGVAPYKLHARDALAEVSMILALGDIELKSGVEVVDGEAEKGQVTAQSLLEGYDAIFIGIGLGPDNFLHIEGERAHANLSNGGADNADSNNVGAGGAVDADNGNADNVDADNVDADNVDADNVDAGGAVGATAYIERLKLEPDMDLKGVRTALVVGGGNTAIDIARELAQLGVDDVAMVYRKTAEAMSGYHHEMVEARKDGVRLVENRQPVAVLRERGRVVGLKVRATDGSEIEETLPADLVALAIGQSRLTQLAEAFGGVELDGKGRVRVDPETQRTANPQVYAGGDCVNGGKEVVNAAQHGKLAARAITASLGGGQA